MIQGMIRAVTDQWQPFECGLGPNLMRASRLELETDLGIGTIAIPESIYSCALMTCSVGGSSSIKLLFDCMIYLSAALAGAALFFRGYIKVRISA